jgi:EAL domain-containing protein (putative c-di-GMP-specific phosphodiesterase class I)
LIIPIGEWVMNAACAQVAAWSNTPLSNLKISVNLSPRQFRDTKSAETIENAMSSNNVDPASIVLEVTENVLIEHENQMAITALQALRREGVQVALDDFGSGYSSFGYLNNISFDILKIDRSFIQQLSQTGANDAIVRAICAMAHTLNIVVVAEGAETEQQVGRIRASLCDRIQGYYFSKPLSAGRFEEFINMSKSQMPGGKPEWSWESDIPLAGIMPALH